jgi:hypothetical protein
VAPAAFGKPNRQEGDIGRGGRTVGAGSHLPTEHGRANAAAPAVIMSQQTETSHLPWTGGLTDRESANSSLTFA